MRHFPDDEQNEDGSAESFNIQERNLNFPTISTIAPMSLKDETTSMAQNIKDRGQLSSGKHNESLICQWGNCPHNQFDIVSDLERHVEQQHVVPLKDSNQFKCQWNTCSQPGVNHDTSGRLQAHLQTHLGTSPYCPIPECGYVIEGNEDVTQHLKLSHGLVPLSQVAGEANTDPEYYANIIKQTYELRTPYWFSKRFIQTLDEGTETPVNMEKVYNMNFDLKQYRIGNYRYKAFLNNSESVPLFNPHDNNNNYKTIIKNQQELDKVTITKKKIKQTEEEEYNDDPDFVSNSKKTKAGSGTTGGSGATSAAPVNVIPNIAPTMNSNPLLQELSAQSQQYKSQFKPLRLDQDIDNIKDIKQLRQLHDKLSSRLLTSSKINKVVTTELSKSISLKRKQWCINQILMDANIELGLPPPPTDIPTRVVQDEVDREILEAD
jgi:hypothetical protein